LAEGYLARGTILHDLERERRPPRVNWTWQDRGQMVASAAQQEENQVAAARMDEVRYWYQNAASWGSVLAMDHLARLCQGDDRTAWLQQAAEHGDPIAALDLGHANENEGRLREAAAWYQKAVEAGWSYPAQSLAEVLVRMGDTEEAVRWAREAATAEYPTQQVLDLLADLLEQRGDTDEAARWRQAKRANRHVVHPSVAVTVAVLTLAVAPFLKALATKLGEDGYVAARRMVKWVFRHGHPDSRHDDQHPEAPLLIVEDPDPKLNMAIWLGTDTSEDQLRALADFDIDAVVDDAKRRKAKGIRIRWDAASKSWKAVDQGPR
jgi:tetratricopeptide (TPR) repeat protein